ncbi:sugar phosphate isomerase/epimerase [Microbacterium pseudoresistens]|uniref:Xylose isomerase-like TIM barrel domain-containing protein n=1 Tax=Microbacterium pseudoresistens TaxID=640634 RepID=A0A7Y9JND5_9MICO|nr:TIM barrel protein [Microbacterium pseudoresistens]NYD54443.1 hypothetical protein [Microbacterium pseudoresistens]
MIIRSGLCSVTFRALEPAHIAALAAESGLAAIEWAGDAHVPPGDLDHAAEVGRITADAGIAVASYGSYFRAGAGEEIAPWLDAAEALGADRVRVWAGSVGSAEATPEERAQVASRVADAALAAAERGLTLALEYHGGTLADTPQATLRLLAEVDHPALTSYWQPTVGAPDAVARDEFAAVAGQVSAIHAFSWWPDDERHPLQTRESLWTAVLAHAAALPAPPRDVLLEFIPDDDPALLPREAAALRRMLAGAGAGQIV